MTESAQRAIGAAPWKQQRPRLPSLPERVLEFVRAHPGASHDDVAVGLGAANTRSVGLTLAQLVVDDRLESAVEENEVHRPVRYWLHGAMPPKGERPPRVPVKQRAAPGPSAPPPPPPALQQVSDFQGRELPSEAQEPAPAGARAAQSPPPGEASVAAAPPSGGAERGAPGKAPSDGARRGRPPEALSLSGRIRALVASRPEGVPTGELARMFGHDGPKTAAHLVKSGSIDRRGEPGQYVYFAKTPAAEPAPPPPAETPPEPPEPSSAPPPPAPPPSSSVDVEISDHVLGELERAAAAMREKRERARRLAEDLALARAEAWDAEKRLRAAAAALRHQDVGSVVG